MLMLSNPGSSTVILPDGKGELEPGQSKRMDVPKATLQGLAARGLVTAPEGAAPPCRLTMPPVIFDTPRSLPQLAGARVHVLYHENGFGLDRFYAAFLIRRQRLWCALSSDGLDWQALFPVEGFSGALHSPVLMVVDDRIRLFDWDGAALVAASIQVNENSATVKETTRDPSLALPADSRLLFGYHHESKTITSGDGFAWPLMLALATGEGTRLLVSTDGARWRLQPLGLTMVDQPATEIGESWLQRLNDGRYWLLHGRGEGLDYAYSWDGFHWRAFELNPVLRWRGTRFPAGMVPDGHGGFRLYLAGEKDVLVYHLPALIQGWRDLLQPHPLGHGWLAQSAARVGRGKSADRDRQFPQPQLGDTWFNTDHGGKGRWERYSGEEWLRA